MNIYSILEKLICISFIHEIWDTRKFRNSQAHQRLIFRKCPVIVFFIVHWETDSLRFMRWHNFGFIKHFWDIQNELCDTNKMEKHRRHFSLINRFT